ncbi:MAG: antitoxin [Xanthomonadales bacterium]|nr:antitoxin [Xanthomonadales bacterium]
MPKPTTFDGYSDHYTVDCERVLVTLLRGLGPWKDSIYLVGGLTPRYLVAARPPDVPEHAGTLDVDVVIDIQLLTNIEAYHTLEANLKKMGFERAENERGQKLSWRWQTRTEHGARIVLDLLTDSLDLRGGRVQPLPTKGSISALNIPHSSIVADMHQQIDIQAELLGGNGVATETIRYADLVAFTCLKSFAFEERNERKDAHDLIYCIEHAPENSARAAQMFRDARAGTHQAVVDKAMAILRKRFAGDEGVEGYLKDGPVSAARFELGDSDEPELRDAGILRQREVSDLIEQLLAGIDPTQ